MSAKAASTSPSIVLLVDVVGSSAVENFATLRDRRIARLTKLHRARNWIAADYTVTAWDEFQSVLASSEALPAVLLDVRRLLAPWDAYIAVGIGAVSGWRSRKPINRALSGVGFARAREAMDELKAGKGEKYRRLTRFRCSDDREQELLNLIYGLHDTLLQQTTSRQWETIGAVMERDTTQEETAARLDVQPSTVTRNLKRGHYWQMQETVRVVSRLLARLARDWAKS